MYKIWVLEDTCATFRVVVNVPMAVMWLIVIAADCLHYMMCHYHQVMKTTLEKGPSYQKESEVSLVFVAHSSRALYTESNVIGFEWCWTGLVIASFVAWMKLLYIEPR